jgi:hypothetical protein
MQRTLLAVALAAVFQSPAAHAADPELDASLAVVRAEFRAELERLKQHYEARIATLEQRFSTAESRADEAVKTADAAAAQARERPVSAPATGFNPDVSLILQGRYAQLDDIAERRIDNFLPAGHGHGASRGFSLDHTELVVSANVDPYFRGYMNLALLDEAVEVEEAWFQTLGLGSGFSIKGGRFLSGIGYQNEQHPHAWDFADNNLAYRVLFGEAHGQDGVQLKWLAPTDIFIELGAELGRGANFPGTDRNKNGAGAWSLFGHVGGDVGASHSWRAGLSYLSAKATDRDGELLDLNDVEVETLFTGKSKTWLADLVWKWAPDGNPGQRNFKFAAEYFQRDEEGSLNCDDLDATNPSLCTGGAVDVYVSDQSGFYAQGVYQLMPRWRVGYRYDLLDAGSVDFGVNNANIARSNRDPSRHSLMVDFSPSEFSRLRLQYSRDASMASLDEDQWIVQYVLSLGAHGAHKF